METKACEKCGATPTTEVGVGGWEHEVVMTLCHDCKNKVMDQMLKEVNDVNATH